MMRELVIGGTFAVIGGLIGVAGPLVKDYWQAQRQRKDRLGQLYASWYARLYEALGVLSERYRDEAVRLKTHDPSKEPGSDQDGWRLMQEAVSMSRQLIAQENDETMRREIGLATVDRFADDEDSQHGEYDAYVFGFDAMVDECRKAADEVMSMVRKKYR